MRSEDADTRMRLQAFEHLKMLGELHDHMTAQHLRGGFIFEGERVPLINPQRGIFKPRSMRYLLSVRTVYPRSGARIWYDDQRAAHQQIFHEEQSVEYAFMGQDPHAADNRWLREAFEKQIPIIYFLGISPACYEAIVPTFIAGWDPSALKAQLIFGTPGQNVITPPHTAAERHYGLRLVQQRLHQASFRQAVLAAYDGRCAISWLAEHQLLDAAHIISDKSEPLGQPVVQNGLLLSKIHHTAFDRHLIGIDPDYRLHVSRQLLVKEDGPMLEALKRLHGGTIRLPDRQKDRPDPDRLALRFEHFRSAA